MYSKEFHPRNKISRRKNLQIQTLLHIVQRPVLHGFMSKPIQPLAYFIYYGASFPEEQLKIILRAVYQYIKLSIQD